MLHHKPMLFSICLALLLPGVILCGSAAAHQGATGVVKERMELMKALGDRMKSMSAMVKGKTPFDASKMAVGALEIRDKSRNIAQLFPEGSLKNPSEALPAIWTQWDKFIELTDRLIREAHSLSDIAASGSQRDIRAQFTRLGKTCSDCHTDYREE